MTEEKFKNKLFSLKPNETAIIFEKQLGFRAGHSTNHEHLELIDQVCECSDEKNAVIFVDLLKAFDTVDRKILKSYKSMEYVVQKLSFKQKRIY